MSDLERDLRTLFDAKSGEAPMAPKPPANVLRLARARQLRTAIVAGLGAVAIMVGSVAGLRALDGADESIPRPANEPILPDAPSGFRSVALPHVSLAYPEEWIAIVGTGIRPTGEVVTESVLIVNFEPAGALQPGLEPGCTEESIPDDGVVLIVSRSAGALGAEPRWPQDLEPSTSTGRWCAPGDELEAMWSSPDGSRPYSAQALIRPGADEEARERLHTTFSSLVIPERSDPQTEGFLGHSSRIIDSAVTPVGPVALYTYSDPDGASWIGIAGPAGSGLGGAAQIARQAPRADEDVTMNLADWGGVVWGVVASTAVRAELRTVEGETIPAELLPLPPLSGDRVEGRQIVWGVVEGPTADRVTTLLFDEQGNVLNDFFPTGPRTTIATGTHPEAGTWELYLETTNQGTGIGFTFEHGGGGSGCCLRPLDVDLQLDAWGSGSEGPGQITALASELVERVVFEAAGGERIDGTIHAVPDRSLDVPQVALVIVPHGVPLDGEIVAYDAAGDEVGREVVGHVGEPPDPAETPLPGEQLFRGRTNDCFWRVNANPEAADPESLQLLPDNGAGSVTLPLDLGQDAPALQLGLFRCEVGGTLAFGIVAPEVREIRWLPNSGDELLEGVGCTPADLPPGVCFFLSDHVSFSSGGEAIALDAEGNEIGSVSFPEGATGSRR